MSEGRMTQRTLYYQHRVTVEEKLFQVIQKFSDKENMTAADVSALAAITEAFLNVQKMGS